MTTRLHGSFSFTFGTFVLLWCATALTACAPAARITLLPQPDRKPSAVVVQTAKCHEILDKPYDVVEVQQDGALAITQTTAQAVAKRYPKLLTIHPAPPEIFSLKFETGTSTLTAESQARLPEVIKAAQRRAGGEILITGHTDRKGAVEDNDALSLTRAQVVRDMIIAKGFKPELVDAVGRGEREPLVPTEDEVIEPRNRRAEVLVR